MLKKAAIVIAVMFVFSAFAQQAQADKRGRTQRRPAKRSVSRSANPKGVKPRSPRSVSKSKSRSANPKGVKPRSRSAKPKVRVQIRSGQRNHSSRPGFRPNGLGNHNDYGNRNNDYGNRNNGYGSRNNGYGSRNNGYGNRNDHGNGYRNGHHQHQYREWVPPIYSHREVEVWVPSVYQTVHNDCHHGHHGQIRIGGFGLRIGSHCEGQRVLVHEGYHEIRTVSYVVREGYWRTLSSCLLCGYAHHFGIGIGISFGF